MIRRAPLLEDLSDVTSEQRRLNRSTANAAHRFALHRSHLTAQVLAAAERGARVMIVGAGNCNDLDLEALATHASQIHLVDLDEEAIVAARHRVPPALAQRVALHGGIDVTGALGWLGGCQRRRLHGEDYERIAGVCIEQVLQALPAPVDAVVSSCLLSQLMDSLRRQLGPQHPDLLPAARVLMVAHLRLLAAVLVRGGQAVLASDTASSEQLPLRELVAAKGGLEALKAVVEAGLCFTGTSAPFAVEILQTDEVLSERVADVALAAPWLWTISEARSYLVYALRFRRSG